MSQPPDSDQDNSPKDGLEIDQAVRGDGNQTVGNMSGGTVIGVQNVYIQTTDHTEYGQPVRQGLNALADLMQASGVKDAVIRFRVVFHAASEQINVVANYKALHDLLHTLEFQCYNVIVRAAKRFPDDDVALDELMEYNLILQNRIEELQQVAARETIAASEVQWLTKLQDAETELQSAIDTLETKPLGAALL